MPLLMTRAYRFEYRRKNCPCSFRACSFPAPNLYDVCDSNLTLLFWLMFLLSPATVADRLAVRMILVVARQLMPGANRRVRLSCLLSRLSALSAFRSKFRSSLGEAAIPRLRPSIWLS